MTYEETINDNGQFRDAYKNRVNGHFSEIDRGYIAHVLNEINKSLTEIVVELKKINSNK